MQESNDDLRDKFLPGWKNHDEFKLRHRNLDSSFYATDADLCLVSKNPPGTVAYIDYKSFGYGKHVTFAEVIQYNLWRDHAPVYIIEGDPEQGRFIIREYLGGDWYPEPPIVDYGYEVYIDGWNEFEKWERNLREEYMKNSGIEVRSGRAW